MAANNETAALPAPYTKSQRDPIEPLYEGVMRQPQVCKHQVCDRCGGRFGMVTHRWWGSKFCRRTCKDAHLREVTLDRDTIRRWFGLPVSRAAQTVGGTASLTSASFLRNGSCPIRAGQEPPPPALQET
jgi:hypothetical protein